MKLNIFSTFLFALLLLPISSEAQRPPWTTDPVILPTIDTGDHTESSEECRGNYWGNMRLFIDDNPTETTWRIINNLTGEVVYDLGPFTDLYTFPGFFYYQPVCLEDGCYTLEVNDSAGDGICCNSGNGRYIFTYESPTGRQYIRGDEFGFSDQNVFCVGQRPCNTTIDNHLDISGAENGMSSWSCQATSSECTYEVPPGNSGFFSIHTDSGIESTVTDLSGYDEITFQIQYGYIHYEIAPNPTFIRVSAVCDGVTTILQEYPEIPNFNSSFNFNVEDLPTSNCSFQVEILGGNGEMNVFNINIFERICFNIQDLTENEAEQKTDSKPSEKADAFNELTEVNESLSIFPNPVLDAFTINSSHEIHQLRITTISGQVISNKSIINDTQASVSVADLAPGVYLLTVYMDHGLVTRRFLKQ